MPIKKIPKKFITTADVEGFYRSTIPKGTTLYAFIQQDEGIWSEGRWVFRFVFDTMENGEAHGRPEGNMRMASWYVKGVWSDAISPVK